MFAPILVFTVASAAQADTKTWTGAVSDVWSVAGNWAGGVPADGDRLVFPDDAAADRSLTNDLASGLDVYDMTFTGDGYTITGNDIDIVAGITNSASFDGNALDVDLSLSGSQTFAIMHYGGTIDLNGNDLHIGGFVEGAIVGTGNVTAAGLGLYGTSTFSGQITNDGGLLVDGTVTGADIVANGFPSGFPTLRGSGVIGTTTGDYIAPGGTLSADLAFVDGIGVLATGDLTPFKLQMQLNGTVPGVGHDQIAVTGGIDLTLPFADPPMTGFSAFLELTVGYAVTSGTSFVLIDNDGSDPVTGTFHDLPEGASVVSGLYIFEISYVGGDGNDIVVTCTSSPKTWTGAVSDLWSVAGNWEGGVPADGDRLVFPDDAAADRSLTNDLASGLDVYDMTFSGDGYTITGNDIDLSAGVTSSFSDNAVHLDLRLTDSQNLAAIHYAGTIDLNGNDARVQGFMEGSIVGTGNVTAAGLGLYGTSTFSGQISNDGGLLVDGTVTGADIVADGLPSGFPTLRGSGVIGTTIGDYIAPGGTLSADLGFVDGIGVLATGDLTPFKLQLQLNGAIPGIGYDQVNVAGGIDLTLPFADPPLTGYSAFLELGLGFTPARGQEFLLVDNDENDAVTNQFHLLAEGASFNLGPYPFTISYVGGTGNDVVVTSLSGDPFNAAPESSDDPYELDTGDAGPGAEPAVGSFATNRSRIARVPRSGEPTLEVEGDGVLANDTDPDDDDLSIVQAPIRSVRGGIVTVAPSGSFTYQPADGFRGTDSFLYLAGDGKGGVGYAYASIFVHTCGDGDPESPVEECDDGNTFDGDGCDTNCTTTRCGNDIVSDGEQCDDGNETAGDCCSPVCSFESAATTCRVAVSPCDVAEACTGTDSVCPSDGFVAAGLACPGDGNPCTNDVCDGTGSCGVNNAAPCDDADACTVDDVCTAGACSGSTLDCDDDNLCTTDSCVAESGCVHDAVPLEESSCVLSARAKIQVSDPDGEEKNRLTWQWSSGEAFDHADLGVPDASSGTRYAICVYDESAGVFTLAVSAQIAPSEALWTSKDPKGYQYKDKLGSSGGVTKAQIKPGEAGRTRIKMSATGVNLVLPGAAGGTYFRQDQTVVAQLVHSLGMCWSSRFGVNDTGTNDPQSFKAQVK